MQSIRTLMKEIVDYAGLFPPAKLDMESTVSNYASYRNSNDAWMLSDLIVPVGRLDEFEEHAAAHLPRNAEDIPWYLNVLTSPADDANLVSDMERIEKFNERHSDDGHGYCQILGVELRASSSAAIDTSLDVISEEYVPFFELPRDGDLRGMIAALSGTGACAKVRTGGVTPDLFPPPATLAQFIAVCATANVPFKATAGLHHPFRHDSATVSGAKEFGFFNVFLGAGLLLFDRIDLSGLEELLAEENTEAFTFDDEHLGWREHRLDIEEIESTRVGFALSYGSCSFVEPLDDLRRLDLID